MLVTIFTDASFDHRTHAAGWSAWIKFGKEDGETQRYFAAIKGDCGCPTGAELAAIANALFVTARALDLSSTDRVILQSDSLDAIALSEGRANRWPVAAEAIAFRDRCIGVISDLRAERGFGLEFRHVKAHRGYGDRRSAVNEWCDSAAKTAMRKKRQESHPC